MIYQLFRYLRGFGWWVGLATFLGALTILSGIGLMGASAYLIVMAGFHPSIAILQVVIVGVRFFGISRSVSRYFERLVSHSVNLRILEKIRISVFGQLERHFPISINDYPSSTILGLFIHDIEILENLFVRFLSPVLISIIVTFLVGIFVGFYAIELVIVITVGIFLVGFAIPFLSARISLNYGNEMALRRTKYQLGLNDYFQYFQEVLLYQRNQTLLEKINSLENQFAKIQIKQGLNQSIFSSISFLGTQATVIIAIFTSLYLIQNKQFAPIMLAIFYTIFTSSFEAVSNFSVVANSYGNVKAAAIHISEIQNIPNISQKKEVINLGAGFDIELSDVSFNYPGTTKKVLKKINMSVQNGEKVAIVGKSGSGKTTLIQLLTGFYDNYSGSIKINSQELSHIDTKNYRNGFSYVESDPYLFDTSIRQNLNLASDGVSDNFLEECLKKVSLDKRIINLDTLVGEHGGFLSGGEKQRLGIARALLQNKRCVFIDEPTANLDPILAIDLINNMLNWFSTKTLVWVMHKYNSMSQFDTIYVINDGVIVEKGNHKELILQKGLYNKLYFDQKKFY
jgi:ATP-binding cassette subfamily C protein CydC